MNEQKTLEQIAKNLNAKHPIPAGEDIDKTIELIEKRLSDKAMNRFKNAPIKEGYELAVKLLREQNKDLNATSVITSIQGRAIAAMAIDYMEGRCGQEVLCGVPLKG